MFNFSLREVISCDVSMRFSRAIFSTIKDILSGDVWDGVCVGIWMEAESFDDEKRRVAEK
jgi:hypothetical protein